jgi:hypothetical protein
MSENCYFWLDASLPQEQQIFNVMCEKCHEKNPNVGWFWEGSEKGYGPFDFVCKTCGHVVYSPNEKNEENKTSD